MTWVGYQSPVCEKNSTHLLPARWAEGIIPAEGLTVAGLKNEITEKKKRKRKKENWKIHNNSIVLFIHVRFQKTAIL
jgi:hypothetical protein